MSEKFELSVIGLQKLQTISELRECNEFTIKFGLVLSETQIQCITEKRFEALKATGRVELGKGILKKLIYEFCDSPYINQDDYQEIVLELQDAFYYFKNESMDIISDDELIAYMKKYFDDVCQGSVEYLTMTTLEDLCRSVRYGNKIE